MATLERWKHEGLAQLLAPPVNGVGQLQYKSGTIETVQVKGEAPAYTVREFKIQVLREAAVDDTLLDEPKRVYDFWQQIVPSAPWFQTEKETLVLFTLNTRRRLTGFNMISIGTLDTILVHPREVMRPAVIANASAMIIAHNHPSGDPSPSEGDIKVTRELIRAGQLLKIELLDHVIIGRASAERSRPWVSLRELGYFC
jgi:DNA repair protein RadC